MTTTSPSGLYVPRGIELPDWYNANVPSSPARRRRYLQQLLFVLEELTKLFYPDPVIAAANQPRVVGEHRVLFINLPIYSMMVPGWLEMQFIGNFEQWVVSISCREVVPNRFHGLFDSMEPLSPVDLQHFDVPWRDRTYGIDRQYFMVKLPSDWHLWTFCFLLEDALNLRIKVMNRPT